MSTRVLKFCRAVLHRKHLNKVLIFFCVNLGLAMLWGPIFITLTLLGPTKHLSSTVEWVAIISYYANMMGNIAAASALYSAMVAHKNAQVIEEQVNYMETERSESLDERQST